MSPKLYSFINYLYIAIAILWKPLQGAVMTFDGKGRILLLFTITSFILNCIKPAFRKLLFSKPVVLWFIWCVYATINTSYHGYQSSTTTFPYFVINQVFCPCMIMAVSAYEYLKNPRRFLKIALWIFLIYAYIGAFVMDIAYVAQEEGSVEVNTLGNSLSLNVMMIIFFAGALYCRKEINIGKVTILVLFAVGIVVISATRKALGASTIMIIAIILSHIKWNISNIIKLSIPLVCLYAGLNFVISNTLMGERLSELEMQKDQVEAQYGLNNNFFLKAMGDRAPQYIIGSQIFMESPITGIGLNNFQRLSKYPFRLHTEYMVQICECGIIGCIIFIAFYVNIITLLIRRISWGNDDRRNSIMMLGGIAALLFIYFTAWSYSICTYFIVLGCIVGYAHSNKLKKT